MDANADLHLVIAEVERRRSSGWHDAARERHAHRAAIRVDLDGRVGHFGERGALLGKRAGDLLQEHRHADAAPARGIQRIQDGHVIVRDDRGDLNLARDKLRRHLEVEHVAGVILDNVQDARTAIDGPGRGLHLIRRWRRENVARARCIEHTETDKAAV